MVFNVIGTSSNKLKKRLIQLVTALAVILFLCVSSVVAGFGAGWIPKDCDVMFILSFKNRVPHHEEVSKAEEEAEDVEDAQEATEGTSEEPHQKNLEAILLNLSNQELYMKYLCLKEKLENIRDGING